jgi:outer membrane protein assembly factor BamE (lipoprotein component of BamABCDE complex)
MIRKGFLLLWVVLALTGCMTAAQHQQTLPSAEERKLTTGVVQKEIRKGMSQADVAAALGSPNLVTKDKKGIETWIYDKISTEYAYSTSSGGVSALVFGWGGSAAGLGGGSHNRSSGASATTQRTLTVIIKFLEGEVNEFTYRSSSF